MFGLLSTSDPSALLSGLRRLPLLAVLRPNSLEQARLQLSQLQQAGLSHVELAVQLTPEWRQMAAALVQEFPGLQLGAASVRCSAGLAAACEAGLGYAVSPILDRELVGAGGGCVDHAGARGVQPYGDRRSGALGCAGGEALSSSSPRSELLAFSGWAPASIALLHCCRWLGCGGCGAVAGGCE